MKNAASFLTLALAMAAAGTASAQVIPVPAGSSDTGARSVVSVVPVNLSNYVTHNELETVDNRITTVNNRVTTVDNRVTTVRNTVTNLGDRVTTVEGDVGTVREPWTNYFKGQFRVLGAGPTTMVAYCAAVDSSGNLKIGMIGREDGQSICTNQTRNLGKPFGAAPLIFSASMLIGDSTRTVYWSIGPKGYTAAGSPTDYSALISIYDVPGEGGGDPGTE